MDSEDVGKENRGEGEEASGDRSGEEIRKETNEGWKDITVTGSCMIRMDY